MERLAGQAADDAPSSEAIDVAAIAVPIADPPRSGLDGLTAQLQAEAPVREPGSDDGPPDPCKHEDCPPSKVAALAPGKSLVCRCGQEFRKDA